MKKLAILILMISIFVTAGYGQNGQVNEIIVTPQNAKINVGDTIQYEAVYFDSIGIQVDTTFNWLVIPDSIGIFENSSFIAQKEGEAEVRAQLDSITGTAEIEVEEPEEAESEEYIEIRPEREKIVVGDTIEYYVQYTNSEGAKIDTNAAFSFFPDSLAEFKAGHLLVAKVAGEGIVVANMGELTDSLEIEIEAYEDDEAGDNDEDEFENPAIEIHPQKDEMTVGDSLEYYVQYTDSNGVQTDTSAVFTFTPDSIAEFTENILIAKAAGEGFIIANMGDLSDTLEMEIEAKENDDEEENEEENHQHLPRLRISPRTEVITLGDTIQYNIVYVDTNAVQTDTTANLTVFPDSLGSFVEENHFIAENVGKGFLVAQLNNLTDSLEIEIEKREEEQDDENENGEEHEYNLQHRLAVTPKDTIVNVGAEINYSIKFDNDEGLNDTTAVEWEMEGMDIGTFANGALTTTAPGFALIKAKLGDYIGSAFVIVEDAASDSDVNTIEITRDHPAPHKDYKTIKNIEEGESWRIGGFPHPLNVYNGGMIYFPHGSLTEDIRIHISIPDFAQGNDSTEFNQHKMLSSINFKVFVEDSLTEPYHFNSPLIVGLVYKRGLLKNLNIDPETLGLYFVEETEEGLEFEPEGIHNTTLSYYRNLIFSNVEHFSTIAIRGSEEGSNIPDGNGDDDQFAEIQIYPRTKKITLGDTIQYNINYIDSNEVKTDTVANLKVKPDSLGTTVDNHLFIAESEGEGHIIAQLDTLTDTLEIEIERGEEQEKDNENEENYNLQNRLILSPQDTIVNVGSVIDFQIKYQSENSLVDTTAEEWEMEGMNIGELTNGKLTTDTTGFALIRAKLSENVGTAIVIVEDAEGDSVNNTIQITRPHMNPMQDFRVVKELQEGEIWRIGGFPHPLNVYNGGAIYFPKGSLDEDIRIHISLPDFVNISPDTVEFGPHNILTGINFEVYVNDTLSEPYHFNTPLIVGMVYKRGLLRNLNIDPETLGLYFANTEDDSVEFDSTGIKNTIHSYYRNLIFSNVEHFSTLVVRGSESITELQNAADEKTLPNSIQLHQNYPNPFNPVTNIKYDIPSEMKVRLDVYNILGQKVRTFVNKEQKAGSYRVQWKAGNLPSGIYMIRLNAGQHITVKRALLIK
ncbi:MAG: T9SS type A sorting domain-containing protein [Candidatus Marinimicrobia bacterium]|nr:T9SS type A sorting domain-containing protein [Candidatus Neomarinimicrobiota bacterium]